MSEGHQCGMLWGAVLAAGVEAGKISKSESEAVILAIQAAKKINESFINRAKTVNCREITRCNQRTVLGMVKYFITGKPLNCARLTAKWAPEAIEAARDGLQRNQYESNKKIVSCASLVAKKMGASEKEALMVAGLAGGIGLSGNTCGALGAAVYIKALNRQRNKPGDTTFKIPEAKKSLDAFLKVTGGETQCSVLCGKYFANPEDHSKYIQNGGCEKIIDVLSTA